MKLASFCRDGHIDCGIVDGQGYRVLDDHPVLGPMAGRHRLGAILTMAPGERRALADWTATARRVDAEQVRLLPAVPLCPVYIYNHGNNPTVWKRQNPVKQWHITRIPYFRVRSFAALSGCGGSMAVPAGAGAAVWGGAEFGVVIGREARRVPIERAVEHIAGIVCLNDGAIVGSHDDFVDDSSPAARDRQNHGMDTVYKNSDCNGAMGPWITTSEELEDRQRERLSEPALERYQAKHLAPWLYDKMMRTRIDGRLVDESYTTAYLYGAEYVIAYLSRFMTLPTGSVIGLGAAGWDGVPLTPPAEPGSSIRVEVELAGVGPMAVTVRRRRQDEESHSHFLATRAELGLPPVPEPEDRPGPAVWVLQGNYPEVTACEGTPLGQGMNALQYPPGSLADAQGPVILPPHATTVMCSMQLAAVIGPRPVYRAAPEAALGAVERIVPIVGFRDKSLEEAIVRPTAYETRSARFLGCCGDGFYRLGPGAPLGALGDLAGLTMTLTLDGGAPRVYRTGNYLHRLEEMIALISRASTLLPGDVLSLGPVGPELPIEPGRRAASVAVETSWGASFRLALDDQRDPTAPKEEVR